MSPLEGRVMKGSLRQAINQAYYDTPFEYTHDVFARKLDMVDGKPSMFTHLPPIEKWPAHFTTTEMRSMCPNAVKEDIAEGIVVDIPLYLKPLHF